VQQLVIATTARSFTNAVQALFAQIFEPIIMASAQPQVRLFMPPNIAEHAPSAILSHPLNMAL
jgi:hypothetical protein